MKKLLTELCAIKYGFAFDSKKFTEDESFVPLIRIRDVQRGYSETYYSGEYSNDYIIKKGDLLVGMDGEFNIARWNSADALLNQRVCKISAKQNVNEEYLRLALTIALKNIEDKTSFVTVKHLSAKELNKLELDVPSLAEQQKIADELDKVQSIIDARKEELKLLDDLIKSRFIEMFESNEYEIFNMGDVCKFQQGTQVPIEDQIDKPVEGYDRFLRIIDYTQAPQSPRYVLSNGRHIDNNSVVVVRYGASAGFVGHGYSGILANNLFEVVPNANLMTKEFLYYELKYGAFETIIRDKAFGAAMPAVSFTMIHDIPIIVPPIELQNQFADFVNQTDKSKQTIKQNIEQLETLKASLMQKYFG